MATPLRPLPDADVVDRHVGVVVGRSRFLPIQREVARMKRVWRNSARVGKRPTSRRS